MRKNVALATWGDAMDVPDSTDWASFRPIQAARMAEPGAAMSQHLP